MKKNRTRRLGTKDVRISMHKTMKKKGGEVVIIRFYDELEQLIGPYAKINFTNDARIYFEGSDVKFSGFNKFSNSTLNIGRGVDRFKNYEGDYDLHFDNVQKLYYIDLKDRVELSRQFGTYGIKHPNYKPHATEPIIKPDISATMKDDAVVPAIELKQSLRNVNVENVYLPLIVALENQFNCQLWDDAKRTLAVLDSVLTWLENLRGGNVDEN